MTIPLSKHTEQLVDTLFEDPLRTRVRTALLEQVSGNIPDCEGKSPEDMERIRFSVIKLIHEDDANFAAVVELVYVDWRDLFMAAGFGFHPCEHEMWFRAVVEGRSR